MIIDDISNRLTFQMWIHTALAVQVSIFVMSRLPRHPLGEK